MRSRSREPCALATSRSCSLVVPPQRFHPEAHVILSTYPGTDRADAIARRYELSGTLLQQARQATEVLDLEAHIVFDKADPTDPNRLRLAQAEGQGIATIFRAMRENGSPTPTFDVTETSVRIVLPAHAGTTAPRR